MNVNDFNLGYQKIELIKSALAKVIKGKPEPITYVLSTLLAGGHLLIEDNPGTGKTVLARTLARAIAQGHGQLDLPYFKRVQFTPDLLPMDLIGASIYDEDKKDFVFKKGPLFCNILLADEINRASPKVQSALLECMAEQQITVGDTTYFLPKVFFTIATQNPIEMEGTYPLPSAQLDRFFMKINFGYVPEDVELEIYKNYQSISNELHTLEPVMNVEEVSQLQQLCQNVYIHEEIVKSVNYLVRATREQPDITLGASTRSGIALVKCLKAFALVNGRDYVIEDDLQAIAHQVLHHRLEFKNKQAKQNLLNVLLQEQIQRLAKLKLQQTNL